MYYINLLLEKKKTDKEAVSWVRSAVAVLIFGLVIYFIIWKIILKVTNVSPSVYQGISYVGHDIFNKILTAPLRCLKDFGMYMLFGTSFSVYSVFMICGYSFSLFVLIFVLVKNKIYKNVGAFITLCVLVALVPFFIFVWEFASDDIEYHGLMVMSLVLPLVFTIPLVEKYSNVKKLKNSTLAVMLVLSFFFIISSNIMYLNYQVTTDSTVETETELKIRIDDCAEENDGILPKKIIFVGTNELENTGRLNDNSIMDFYVPSNLVKSYREIISYFNYTYSYNLEEGDESYIIENYYDDVYEMSCWPSSGSVKIIDDTVIVKFSNDIYFKK